MIGTPSASHARWTSGICAGQLVGHRLAVRFVVGGEIVAEGASGQIERRGDELRRVILEQLAQHRDEDVDRVGRKSLSVAQQRAFSGADRRVDTRGTSASCRR